MQLRVKKAQLIQKRQERNLSQHRLSLLAGLSNNAVYRMENTDCKVHHLRAKAIAETLSCPIEDLFEVRN